MPVNYKLGKIYKIEDNTNNNCYIGSTCEPILARRLAQHCRYYKCYLNGKVNYVSSFDILKNNNYDIILIESYPCNSKDELFSREIYWKNQLDCVNKNKNQGVILQLGNKAYQKEYQKEYHEKHHDKILESKKLYRENNKEKLKNANKIYREEKREELKIKFTCDCGSTCRISDKSTHNKTTKHQNYLKSLQQPEQ